MCTLYILGQPAGDICPLYIVIILCLPMYKITSTFCAALIIVSRTFFLSFLWSIQVHDCLPLQWHSAQHCLQLGILGNVFFHFRNGKHVIVFNLTASTVHVQYSSMFCTMCYLMCFNSTEWLWLTAIWNIFFASRRKQWENHEIILFHASFIIKPRLIFH
jgi:hypothetical protein